MSEADPIRPGVLIGRRGQVVAAVAAAVDTVAGARRTGGDGVEVATQYPGGRALGVQLEDRSVVVHLVAETLPLEVMVEEVRTAALEALRSVGDHRAVVVAVDDLDLGSLPRGWR
jgi:hypothetical protein